MTNKKIIYLDFNVDRLTNSIENAISGEVFDTLIEKVTDGTEIKKANGCLIGKMKLRTKQNLFQKIFELANSLNFF